MFGKNFIYNGRSSEEFDVMIGSLANNNEVPLGLSRNILVGETNRFRTSPNHMGTNYNNVLVFNVTFLKNPCHRSSQDDMYFTEEEVDNINAWLTSSDYPSLFHMYDYDEIKYKKYDYFGIFSDVEAQVINGYIVGLSYTFTTNSPYAFTEVIQKQFYCVGETTLTIDVNNSERQRELYPVITILPTNTSEAGRVNIGIKNVTDGNRELTLNVLKEPITIDCQKSKIYDALGLLSFDDLGISDIDYVYWPRLYHGQNNLVITGDVSVTFAYREPRKVGAY